MSKFRGAPQRHDLPGAYSMCRRLDSTIYAFGGINSAIDFRDAAWFGACPLLTTAQKAAAMERGEVKRVDIRLVSGTTCRIAQEADPGVGSGNRWGSTDSTVRIRRVDFANASGAHQVWLDSDGGAVTLEVEVVFDIPSEDDL